MEGEAGSFPAIYLPLICRDDHSSNHGIDVKITGMQSRCDEDDGGMHIITMVVHGLGHYAEHSRCVRLLAEICTTQQHFLLPTKNISTNNGETFGIEPIVLSVWSIRVEEALQQQHQQTFDQGSFEYREAQEAATATAR